MSPLKIPKIKKPELPKVKALDPEILGKIKELVENAADLVSEDTSIGEMVEDEIKGIITEKIMEQLEPQLDNDIVKKLAEKAVEKAVDKSWDKIKDKIAAKFEKESEE